MQNEPNSEFYLKEGLSEVRRDTHLYRHLPLGESMALRFRAKSRKGKNTTLEFVRWLNVEKSERYQPTTKSTFCNIYLFDYCYISNVYFPRTQKLAPDHYNDNINTPRFRELMINDLFDWLGNSGHYFGWKRADSLEHIQDHANNGDCAIIIAKSRVGHGHGSVVCPESENIPALRRGSDVICPVQSAAGRHPFIISNQSAWWTDKAYDQVSYWFNTKPEISLLDNRVMSIVNLTKLFSYDLSELIDITISKLLILAEENKNLHLLDDIIIDALVVAEDRRFFYHPGFDLIGIIRAIWNFIIGRPLQGASTIEQQLSRTLNGRRELSFDRKIKEIIVSIILSKLIDKRSIASIYLRNAYYGWRMNGLDQALSRLRHKADAEIGMDEACELVSYLKYPLPREPSNLYKTRQGKRVSYIRDILDNRL